MGAAEEYLYKQECYDIIGAAMEVHRTLGPGFLEGVYQEALEIELETAGIPYDKEVLIDINYKGIILDKKYIADFVCYDEIIVELKAIEMLAPEHTAQVLNYLKATRSRLGLLMNFGGPQLQHKRIIL
jgi:GxxExxY protein